MTAMKTKLLSKRGSSLLFVYSLFVYNAVLPPSLSFTITPLRSPSLSSDLIYTTPFAFFSLGCTPFPIFKTSPPPFHRQKSLSLDWVSHRNHRLNRHDLLGAGGAPVIQVHHNAHTIHSKFKLPSPNLIGGSSLQNEPLNLHFLLNIRIGGKQLARGFTTPFLRYPLQVRISAILTRPLKE